ILTLEFRMVRKERIDHRAIRFKKRAGTIANAIKVIECNYSQTLRWMYRASIGEVDNLPHSLHEIRLRYDPSTTDTAQPVRLCETASDNEVWPKVKCRAPWLVEQSFEIDLVDQDTCAYVGCDLAHLLYGRLVGE